MTNTFAVARSYLLPYAQTWNFSVQEEFKGVVVEANYLGTKGTRLDVLRLPNRAAPGSPLTAEERRQIGNAVGFTYDSSEGNSIFHAIQLRVVRRLRRGVSTNVFYTFSKSIDNASSIGGTGNVVAQDDRNLAAERGLSIFDQRHQLTWTSMLNSPFGERSMFLKSNTLGSRILRSWNLSTSVTARSGRPFTARVLGNCQRCRRNRFCWKWPRRRNRIGSRCGIGYLQSGRFYRAAFRALRKCRAEHDYRPGRCSQWIYRWVDRSPCATGSVSSSASVRTT